MLISRAAINDYLDRDFDSWTWLKKLSKSQVFAELDRFKVQPVFKTEPWLHQAVCHLIGMYHPRFLFLLGMGTGKSKIISDLVTQVQRERKLEGALVFVPRLTNIDSWLESLAVHSDLEPWPVSCSDIEEKYERLLQPKGDVTLIDYQGFHLAVCKKVPGKGKKKNLVRDDKKVKALQRRYNLIGLDESHKLSNRDSLWFGLVKQMTEHAEYCYATTGTLFGKNVEPIWSQFRLVDGGETFGENVGLFKASLFTVETLPFKTVYNFNPRMRDQLHKMLQHRSLRYDEDEVLDLPVCVRREKATTMGDEQREHYLRALQGLINAGGQVSQMESEWLRMRQITSGYLAWKDGHGNHVLHFKENPKLEALCDLIEDMGDSKIVVCYDYTETGRMIVDRLKTLHIGHEWFYGGTKDKSGSRQRFLDDPDCRVFVMNSEAGGTGNDGLQKVARYMVFYESPTPAITRKQTEARIHRPGQTKRSFIYDLVMRKSSDRGILEAIKEGSDLYKGVVNGQKKNKSFFLMD